MKLFSIGKAFSREREKDKRAEAIQRESENYQLATDGGYLLGLKYLLFALFGYYNARLFVNTVPGLEGYGTALCALTGEGTALYCINNYTRSAGAHKTALGFFGALLTIFSVVHATLSFFRIHEWEGYSAGIEFYARRVAFPLLFSLLMLAAIVIPLLHWRKKIAAEQAKAQVQIAADRARVAVQTAALRNEALLEGERLAHFEEELRIEGEYVAKLEQFAALKQRELEAINRIGDPDLRQQIALALGRSADQQAKQPPATKPGVFWPGREASDTRKPGVLD
jgi:hypothetical protein